MQAIETRYLGPTNHRGARIKATTASGISKTVPYDHALSGMACHWEAARALAESLGWSAGEYVGGGTKSGYVFIACEYRPGVPGERFTVAPKENA